MEAVREELVTFEPFSDLDELTLQDRMTAIDEPSSRQVLAASHHILAAVFTQCFDPDLEDIVFAALADVGSACDRCKAPAHAGPVG